MAKVKQVEVSESFLWVGGAILTVLFLVWWWGRSSASSRPAVPPDAPYLPPDQGNTPTAGGGSSGSGPSFDPGPLVTQLNEGFQWLWSDSCSAYEKAMKLSNNQFIAVYNHYKNVYGITLREEYNDTWTTGCSIFGIDYGAQFIERIDRLNLP